MEPWNCQESEIWAAALAGNSAADAPNAAAATVILLFIFDSPGRLNPGQIGILSQSASGPGIVGTMTKVPRAGVRHPPARR